MGSTINIVNMGVGNIVQSSSNDLLQKSLQDSVADVEAIEEELDEQLKFLGEEVDQGFAQIGELCKQGMSIAKSIGNTFGSEKLALGLGAVACVGSAVMGAMQKMDEAKAHNEALDKLLRLKKKIASEKLATTEMLSEKAEKARTRLLKWVDAETEKKFDYALMTSSAFALQQSNMLRVMLIYRQSYYCKILTDFLCSEYRAWKRGQHCCSQNRPSYYDVNYKIVQDLFGERKVANVLPKICKKDILSGADVYALMDTSLLGPTLCEYGLKDVDRKQLESLPSGISQSAKFLLNENPAYKSYKKQSFWFKYEEPSLIIGSALIIVLLVIVLFSWLDWYAWIEWTLGIIISLAGTWLIGVGIDDLKLSDDVFDKARSAQMKMGGYVEIFRPDFSKKSVAWAGVSGAMKGLLSSFE